MTTVNIAAAIHAARHASGGADPITPLAIGADAAGAATAAQSAAIAAASADATTKANAAQAAAIATAASDATTKVAAEATARTTAIASAVTGLINGAPGALDTLNELATALGDDAAFATTVTNSLAAKAPLASPALTGAPTINGHTPVTADQSGTVFDPAGAAAGLALVFGV